MVSKNTLDQYSYLQHEIKYLSKRINDLKNEKVKYEEKKKHDMVRASSRNFPYIEHNVHIEGLENINEMSLNAEIEHEIKKLESRQDNLLNIRHEVLDFIDKIEDSHIRMIITYRFIENNSWNDVAEKIGGGNTGDGVRMTFNRFMEKM